MPASSRKRNKGKERKAKQLARNEREEANMFWLSFGVSTTGCNHGHEIVVADDHPVFSFMDTFYMYLLFKKIPKDQVIQSTFVAHPQVWNNESYRKIAIGILLRIGTNMMWYEAHKNEKQVDMSWPVYVAQSIVVLEQYNGSDIGSVSNSLVVRSKWRDLNTYASSIKRDLLKFYRKRVSCKCLKKMHLEARKTTPKMGICYGCLLEYERVDLSVCSRCMVMPYCSRECQVAAWPVHERYCDDYVKAIEILREGY